jgi:hypothetical protein
MIRQGDFIIERTSSTKKIKAYLGRDMMDGEIRIYKMLLKSFRFNAPIRNTEFTDEDSAIIDKLASDGRIRYSEEEIVLKKDFVNFMVEVLESIRERNKI